MLVDQGPNSRSAKRMEFTSVDQVGELAGLTVGPAPELALVAELGERLAADHELAAAFADLTPGRRREYNLYFAGAKQASTRHARVERYVPRIRAGKGLRDR